MKKKWIAPLGIAALLCTLMLISLVQYTAAAERSAEENDYNIAIIHTDATGATLELTVNRYQVETRSHGSDLYQQLLIDGMQQEGEAGAPQIAVLGMLLGVPALQGISVQVVDAETESLTGYQLYPAPALQVAPFLVDNDTASPPDSTVQEMFARDETLYATDAFYPGAPVTIEPGGYLRDQATARVRFYPVQYNPVSEEIRLYRRLRVRINWPAQVSAAASMWQGEVYESILEKSLLNYASLHRSESLRREPRSTSSSVQASSTNAVTQTQLKLTIGEPGLYQLTYNDLAAAGLPVDSLDPRRIQIHNRGSEVAIYVAGEADGSFDPEDFVLFYGRRIPRNIYTTKNVYWLTSGDAAGQRMALQNGAPVDTATPLTQFPASVHLEKDAVYWGNVPAGIDKDAWFWSGLLNPGQVFSATFNLGNLSTQATTATVRARLHGYTGVAGVDPDHHSQLFLNGVQVSDQTWDGQIVYEQQGSIDHTILKNGDNVVEIKNKGGTGASVDQILVNWFEVDFWDTLVAENNQLQLRVPATDTYTFDISNFTGTDIWTLDISDPDHPLLITNTQVITENSTYRLRFTGAADLASEYLIQTQARHRKPEQIQIDVPSTWKTPEQQADYIIVTHQTFYSDVLKLADFQNAAGRTVRVVTVEDIYDEFNYGIFNPQAIRDFLTYAYANWQRPAPVYVLMAGGASMDYRRNLSGSRTNFVPTQMVDTGEFGERPSDNWFALVSGADILPDLLIGRLPAQSRAEMQVMVDKIIAYAQNPPDSSWNSKVLMVADDDDSSFVLISDKLVDRLPHTYAAQKVYVGNYPPGNPTDDIVSAINSGSVFVNYVGHGNLDNWAIWPGGRTFNAGDVSKLSNAQKLTVVVVGNCLNGYFAWSTPSTAEVFMRSQGKGAVAVWAPSGLDYARGHEMILQEFYDAIFQNDQYHLGAATTIAKIETYAISSLWTNLVQTYVLFGDPAQAIGIPTNYPTVKSVTPADGASAVSVDQPLRIQLSKPTTILSATLRNAANTSIPLQLSTKNIDNTEYTYTHADLGYGQSYTLTIEGQDRIGNFLQDGLAPKTISFTTSTDAVPPTGSIHVTGGTTTNVPLTATVTIQFNEPMRPDSFVYSIEPSTQGWLSWSTSGQEVYFRPIPEFLAGEQYTFRVTATRDLAGNSLAAPLELTFTTQAAMDSIYLPLIQSR